MNEALTEEGFSVRKAFAIEMSKRGLTRNGVRKAYNAEFGTTYGSIGLMPKFIRDLPDDRIIRDEMFFSNPELGMDDRGARHKRCVICKGHYPFPSEFAHGIMPNRKMYPHVFICWECVHWLHKVFNDHINNFSYSLLFSERKIKVGELASRVIRNEKVL